MAATTTRGRSVPRLQPPPAPAPAAAPVIEAAADALAVLAPVLGALIRTVQAALASAAADLGRGDMGANAALVRLGAAREDVETLRAFLAAQPRPAHIAPED